MNSPGAYIYILHGEDELGREEALRTLKERMRSLPAGEHNLSTLRGEEATVAGLRLAADAAPFLSDRRMVVVEGLLARLQGRGAGAKRPGRRSGASAGNSEGEYRALLEYLDQVPPTTSLAFVEPTVVQAEEVARAIPKGRAFVRVFPPVRPEDVPRWIRQRARLLGVDLDEAAVRELARLGGGDLRRLDQEIRKLAAYADGRTVTRADVQALVVAGEASVWALLDALAERRRDRALAALRQLYSRGVHPEAIAGRDVAPLYRRLLAAKELSLVGRQRRADLDPALLGLNPKTLPRLMEQAARFESAELERALELLLALDRQVKGGETELEAGLEVVVVQLCSRLADREAA